MRNITTHFAKLGFMHLIDLGFHYIINIHKIKNINPSKDQNIPLFEELDLCVTLGSKNHKCSSSNDSHLHLAIKNTLREVLGL